MQRDEALRILRDHREEFHAYGVKHLALFGSVARDEAGPDSDVDILVEFDEPVGLFRLLDLKDHLERLLGSPVDLGTEDGVQPRTRARVLREVVDVVTRGALKPRLAPRVERGSVTVCLERTG